MRAHVFVAVLLGGVVAARPAAAAPFMFDTLPADGLLAAAPGETVGWGYTITNPSNALWLLITDISADPVQDGMLDTSVFDFPVLAPLATVVRPFDAVAMLGLASFVWDAAASAGAFNQGVFQLDADFYDGDPFLTGSSFVEKADPASAGYRVDFQSATPVPEPGTLLLVASGAAAALLRTRRSRWGRDAPLTSRLVTGKSRRSTEWRKRRIWLKADARARASSRPRRQSS